MQHSRPSALSIVAELNTRFDRGETHRTGGVLLHSFDRWDLFALGVGTAHVPAHGWRRPSAAWHNVTGVALDRLSASFVSVAGLAPDGRGLPLYSTDAAGVVVSPHRGAKVRCAFPSDSGTKQLQCEASASCVPGCVDSAHGRLWCSPNATLPTTKHCAWPALPAMLNDWHRRRSNTTNEVVLDADYWLGHLPHSVEAIFFVEGGAGCEAQIWCRTFAEQLHRLVLRQYRLTPDELPLVRLDPHAPRSPFLRAG